ncbi:hypothetical protein MTR67_051143 [Solanum verrucosum]|uniref:Uncharacterized protein n=1 Tax=Solanum verrucosum TaxID=315347 RepID=A0AAF0V2R1_SOLVR|nr:hypothetical protein MTR67_051143 [Solanum verrucosum]
MDSLLGSYHHIEILSPFLFIIAIEGLDDMLKTAQEKLWIKGINVSNRVGADIEITHLQYADNTLVFCDDNREQLKILRVFQKQPLYLGETVVRILVGRVGEHQLYTWACPCPPGSIKLIHRGVDSGKSHEKGLPFVFKMFSMWRGGRVLAFSRRARESSTHEQVVLNEKMQEYKKEVDQESRRSLNSPHNSSTAEITQHSSRSSQKVIEAVMQSAAEGKVETIKQGYLSKRSSNLRGDWKRRFFVLDSRGMLYYYRTLRSRSSFQGSSNPLSSHYHGGVHDEKPVARRTVNLLTSTIKADAEQSDLRFCFRIISPTKSYTLQAESTAEQLVWIEKITGVITSLLSSQIPERHFSMSHSTKSRSIGSPMSQDQRTIEECSSGRDFIAKSSIRQSKSASHLPSMKVEKPTDALKRIPGNDKCADCGAPDPDWASLNLGILICIECSGIHRKFGVHISKASQLSSLSRLVRSLALDVKVWEPSVIILFQALGNVFVNSIWEGLLHPRRNFQADEIPMRFLESHKHKQFSCKPSEDDHISVKEKFIHGKYAEKKFVHKVEDSRHLLSVAQQLWEGVRKNDKKTVYRLIVVYQADVNAVHGQASLGSDCANSLNPRSGSADLSSDGFFDGCSLLHLACQTADIGMVELLLQHGANINACDLRGQIPLHHSFLRGRTEIAKLLLSRGADPQAVDKEGKTPFHLVQESALDDVEIIALLKVAIG